MLQKHNDTVAYRADLGTCQVPIGLRSVGQTEFPPRHTNEPRKTAFFQFIWTVEGEGTFRVRGRRRAVKKDCALLVPPEDHYQIANHNDRPWMYRWFTFDGPAAQVIAESFAFPEVAFFAGECPHEIFDALVATLENPSMNSERMAGARMYRFLSELAGLAAGQIAIPTGPSAIERFEKLSEQEVLLGNVEGIAQASGVSRFTIHRLFKQATGMGPKTYSDLLRLRKAVSLLRNSTIPIREIAQQTGFANSNYFAKFFRKKTGRSPSEFRNEQSLP